jgi:DNA-binding transcriptional LysR family regulator
MDRLRTMESFVRVARAGSFTMASRQLGLSRAVISRQVADLEAHLGIPLLNRSTRFVGLTDEGAVYLDYCERILGEMEAADCIVAANGKAPVGTVKVLAPKSFGSVMLTDAVVAFIKSNPQVRVSLILNDFTFRPYDFVEGGFDLGIRNASVRDSSLLSRRIGTLEWVLCAAPDYLKREGAPKRLAELTQRPCLAHVNLAPDDRVWHFRGAGSLEAVRIDGPFLSNSALALRKAALAGVGIALLPRYCINEDLSSGALRQILPLWKVPRRPIMALYPRSTHVPPKVRVLVDYLAQWFGAGRTLMTQGSAAHPAAKLPGE